MNIFAIHKIPEIAVTAYCDQHIVKMTLETAQLLDNIPEIKSPARKMSGRHICEIAIRENKEVLKYTLKLQLALFSEYKLRFGKHHIYDCSPYVERIKNILDSQESLNSLVSPTTHIPLYPLAFSKEFREKNNFYVKWVTNFEDWVNNYINYYSWKLDTIKGVRYFREVGYYRLKEIFNRITT